MLRQLRTWVFVDTAPRIVTTAPHFAIQSAASRRALLPIALALGALVAPVAAAAAEPTYPVDRMCRVEELCRRCDGPACMKVAEEQPWPSERLDSGLSFDISGIRLLLPAAPEKISIASDGAVFVRYPGRKVLAIEQFKPAQFGLPAAPQGAPKAGGRQGGGALTFADVPRILFTKTPADAEPPEVADRRIWRLALTGKHSAFALTERPFFFRRGPVTVFVRGGVARAADPVAYLVEEPFTGKYVTISAFQFEHDDFMRMLGSIEIKEPKR